MREIPRWWASLERAPARGIILNYSGMCVNEQIIGSAPPRGDKTSRILAGASERASELGGGSHLREEFAFPSRMGYFHCDVQCARHRSRCGKMIRKRVLMLKSSRSLPESSLVTEKWKVGSRARARARARASTTRTFVRWRKCQPSNLIISAQPDRAIS